MKRIPHLIAPSILSADFGDLNSTIDLINASEADWFHVDVMDGMFVPNISFGFPVMEALQRRATKPLDVHLMIESPERYIERFRALGAHVITVHFEACKHLHRVIHQIKETGALAGVAINPHTSVTQLADVLGDLDLVLVMSVNPGFGGQKFIYQSIPKVAQLRQMANERNLFPYIEVDGGIGPHNAERVLQAGANVLVAGNAVLGADDPNAVIRSLKAIGQEGFKKHTRLTLFQKVVKVIPFIAGMLMLCDLHSQQTFTLFGTIKDQQDNQPIELVSILSQKFSVVSNTDVNGKYEIELPASQNVIVQFRRTAYDHLDFEVTAQPAGTRYELNITLKPVKSDMEVVVTGQKIDDAGMIRENVEGMKLIPSTTGNLESLLPYIALGTTSGTGGELTSQYNVRGGNYDENLVYVNDFEIYRPLLIRSGNQEGLSLPNPDLMRDLSFSSGGFEAKYGDRMSSVLDVRYKLPDSLRGSLMVSLLGASGHLEGSLPVGKDGYKRWRYLVGLRYKTSAYLLGSLDVQGEYNPSFTDYQIYTTLDLSRDWQLGLLANINKSKYDFIPVSSETATGLISFALKLSTDFEGAESDLFVNGMTGLALSYVPDRKKNPLFVKFLLSGYKSLEQENLDIIGQYRLSQIETDINDPGAGEEVALLGTGTQHVYSRNVLQTNILNAEVKGGIELQQSPEKSNFIQAGLRATYQDFTDHIHEWERLDSAGYSLPNELEELDLLYVLNSDRDISSFVYAGYVQNTYTRQYGGGKEIRITGGLRGQYSEVNKEFFLSPRVQFTYTPVAYRGYKFAAGWYYQPPFYKELRMPDGVINQGVLAQKSFQVLAGYTAGFGPDGTLGPKYKLIIEAYYKSLWDLVSYEVDNVRIRYAGANNATGYLAGIDFRINGELVPGAESWINLSFLRAREQLDGIQHLEREVGQAEGVPVNDVPRPTDQFMNLNVFFQDYLPNNDNFRVHLNLSVGTGLPFGIKGNNTVYRNVYRYKPYHRVDIGFSFRLWSRLWEQARPKSFFRMTRDSWMSIEIFNLLQVRNEASRTWVKTIFLQQYAIPNYLTSRRINLKFRFEF